MDFLLVSSMTTFNNIFLWAFSTSDVFINFMPSHEDFSYDDQIVGNTLT